MRTTSALREQDWDTELLHIRSTRDSECAAIDHTLTAEVPTISTARARGRPSGQYRPSVYRGTGSEVLREIARSDWTGEFRDGNHGRGPFSLVHLNYTDVTARASDLQRLLQLEQLITRGILAVTCPARAPNREEIGGGSVRDTDVQEALAGFANITAEVKQACKSTESYNLLHEYRQDCQTFANPLKLYTYRAEETLMLAAIFVIMPTDACRFLDERHDMERSRDMLKEHSAAADAMHEVRNSASCWQWIFPSIDFDGCGTGNIHGFVSKYENLRSFDDSGHTWAALVAWDWQEKEERREHDFLIAVYSREQAAEAPDIHTEDRAAYRKFVEDYDMGHCRFIGDMGGVNEQMSLGGQYY